MLFARQYQSVLVEDWLPSVTEYSAIAIAIARTVDIAIVIATGSTGLFPPSVVSYNISDCLQRCELRVALTPLTDRIDLYHVESTAVDPSSPIDRL